MAKDRITLTVPAEGSTPNRAHDRRIARQPDGDELRRRRRRAHGRRGGVRLRRRHRRRELGR